MRFLSDSPRIGERSPCDRLGNGYTSLCVKARARYEGWRDPDGQEV